MEEINSCIQLITTVEKPSITHFLFWSIIETPGNNLLGLEEPEKPQPAKWLLRP